MKDWFYQRWLTSKGFRLWAIYLFLEFLSLIAAGIAWSVISVTIHILGKQMGVVILFWVFYVIVPAIIVINAIRLFIKALPKHP